MITTNVAFMRLMESNERKKPGLLQRAGKALKSGFKKVKDAVITHGPRYLNAAGQGAIVGGLHGGLGLGETHDTYTKIEDHNNSWLPFNRLSRTIGTGRKPQYRNTYHTHRTAGENMVRSGKFGALHGVIGQAMADLVGHKTKVAGAVAAGIPVAADRAAYHGVNYALQDFKFPTIP